MTITHDNRTAATTPSDVTRFGTSTARPKYPDTTRFLPGRTVTDGMSRGVIVQVVDGDFCTVQWSPGFTEQCPPADLAAVNPDRPSLSGDELFAATLGEELARRAGAEALAGFHRGHNDGRVGYTEAARMVLARIDGRALTAKHSGCAYTYVVDPQGQRRANREGWADGDRLITCTFFVDGPDSLYCGPHTNAEPGSIYMPTPPGMPIPGGLSVIEGTPLSPFAQAGAL